MSDYRLVGKDVASRMHLGVCCENCDFCIKHNLMDDPIGYYCNEDKTMPNYKEPRTFAERITPEAQAKQDEYEKWLDKHLVSAGTRCEKFRFADVVIQIFGCD